MRTVSSRVNEKEFEAISEYANQTGETVSNVLKKAVFERAAKSKDGCPDGYRLNRRVHQGMDKEESLSKDVDIIRSVLGWDESLEQTKSADVKQPNGQTKVTLESYANHLRKKKEQEEQILAVINEQILAVINEQILAVINEQILAVINEQTKELREGIAELKDRLSS